MLLFLLLTFLGLVTFHVCTRYSRSGRLINKIPGVTAYPLLGNIPLFATANELKLWDISRTVSAQYYPITKFWSIQCAIISIRHPDDIKVLLTSHDAIKKGYMYNLLHPWLKTGILTSQVDKWRIRRKMLTVAFHFNILKTYYKTINEEGIKFVDKLKNEGAISIQDVGNIISDFTLNVICESAMGVTLDNMDSNVRVKYKKAIHDFNYVFVYRIFKPYICDWMIKPFWKIGRMHYNALNSLHSFADNIIKERRAYHEKTNNEYLRDFEEDSKSDNVLSGHKERLAMLDLLLAAEKQGLIDSEGIKEEVNTLIFGGHDTSSAAITFLMLLLAENKEAQNRARTEVIEVLNKNGGQLKMENLQELHFVERCIKESLRLYPVASTIFRCPEADIKLKHAIIPAGTDTVVHFYDLHRDPNFWSEPDKFDPDRFLPERSVDRHPFAFLPFSAGPRNCIGQKFAMMEMKTLIAYTLHNFYLEPVTRTADIRIKPAIVFQPHKPVMIKFITINK